MAHQVTFHARRYLFASSAFSSTNRKEVEQWIKEHTTEYDIKFNNQYHVFPDTLPAYI